jgi:GAF domain-containing protein
MEDGTTGGNRTPGSRDHENRRLRALSIYRILDTESEESLDDLTRLAAEICDAPISLISFVDKDRQWFKSRIGMSLAETPRDMSFCSEAILHDEVMIVEDAHTDPRFAANPLVIAAPAIRFYAGAQLAMANGMALGTLCVIDHKPRGLTAFQLTALKTLRKAVITQLELRRAVMDLHALEQMISICAWCRKILGDDGIWRSPYSYVAESGDVTHGMCPDCLSDVRRRRVRG